jgi:hypothetical protein
LQKYIFSEIKEVRKISFTERQILSICRGTGSVQSDGILWNRVLSIGQGLCLQTERGGLFGVDGSVAEEQDLCIETGFVQIVTDLGLSIGLRASMSSSQKRTGSVHW